MALMHALANGKLAFGSCSSQGLASWMGILNAALSTTSSSSWHDLRRMSHSSASTSSRGSSSSEACVQHQATSHQAPASECSRQDHRSSRQSVSTWAGASQHSGVSPLASTAFSTASRFISTSSSSSSAEASSSSIALQTPKPYPRYPKVPRADKIKWRRMVLRFPPSVRVIQQDSQLLISGRAGAIRVNLQHMDPTGLLGMQVLQQDVKQPDGSDGQQTLVLCCSPSRKYFRGIATHVNNCIQGVTNGYLVGITVKGVGFRLEPVEEPQTSSKWYFEKGAYDKPTAAYPYNKPVGAVRLKVGYTRTAIYPLPDSVRAFFVKPTLMYLYGVELDKVRNVAMAIRKVRPPNPYTGNGIQLVDEVVKLRQRAGSK